MSDARVGPSNTLSPTFWYLCSHGPTPIPHLPVREPQAARNQGIPTFYPHSGTGGQHTVGVMYLPIHDPSTVIRTWIEANKEILMEVSRAAVTRRLKQTYGTAWVAAWQSVADDYEWKAHQQAPADAAGNPERICPKCSESIGSRQFVKHLTNCDA